MWKKHVLMLFSVAGLAIVLFFLFFGWIPEKEHNDARSSGPASAREPVSEIAGVRESRNVRSTAAARESVVASDDKVSEADPEVRLSDEEKKEAEEDALVDAFDGLTDKWMESKGGGVTMKDVEEFSERFRKLPKSRKEECLQRALNLIPDENIMLLAGILMDKKVEREFVELVFGDVLNRDESVKKPIMLQVFKDRSHPCWADTAWIFDVTGELPSRK